MALIVGLSVGAIDGEILALGLVLALVLGGADELGL